MEKVIDTTEWWSINYHEFRELCSLISPNVGVSTSVERTNYISAIYDYMQDLVFLHGCCIQTINWGGAIARHLLHRPLT